MGTRALQSLSTSAAAVWGCALGLDAMICAGIVYERTGAAGLAALAGIAALAASALAVAIALSAAARR